MPLHLDASNPNFESAFSAFLATKREASEDVDATVRAIIGEVREHGDRAVIELTRRFDRLDLAAVGMRVTEAEIAAAVTACNRETMAALELARAAGQDVDDLLVRTRTALRGRSRYASDCGHLASYWRSGVMSSRIHIPRPCVARMRSLNELGLRPLMDTSTSPARSWSSIRFSSGR
jgi:hypothetical protein